MQSHDNEHTSTANKQPEWKRSIKKTDLQQVLSCLDTHVRGKTAINAVTREIKIGEERQKQTAPSSSRKTSTVQQKTNAKEIRKVSKSTKKFQILLNALLDGKDVNFKIDENKKILKAKYNGKSYNLTKILKNVDWSEISFDEGKIDQYANFILLNPASMAANKPLLPNKIDPDTGKVAEKNCEAPQFKCKFLENTELSPAIFDDPKLHAAYVLHDGNLYFANRDDKEFHEIKKLDNTQISKLQNIAKAQKSASQVGDDLISYVYNELKDDTGLKAKKDHWNNWYHEQANNYKQSHADSRLDEWELGEMLGMNLYTGEFYNYANRLLRGHFELFSESKLTISGDPDSDNQVYNAIQKGKTNTVVKELLLGTAMAMHGLHTHPETKKFTARLDRLPDNVYLQKINSEFTESAIVSAAYSATSFIDENTVTHLVGKKVNILVFYIDAQGAGIMPLSQNPSENEFTQRPGKYTYREIGEVGGVKILVAEQTRKLLKEKPDITPKLTAEDKRELYASLANETGLAETKQQVQEPHPAITHHNSTLKMDLLFSENKRKHSISQDAEKPHEKITSPAAERNSPRDRSVTGKLADNFKNAGKFLARETENLFQPYPQSPRETRKVDSKTESGPGKPHRQ